MSQTNRIRFGYTVFDLSIDEQIELAILAESLGFDAAWFGEHIVLPYGSASVYSPTGRGADATEQSGLPKSIYDADTRLFDLIALCGAVARETQSISLITGIYLAGLRHPLMTARAVASLHEMSEGRFQLGLGAGWNKGEYEALGGNFKQRGSILDETVEILRRAMRGGPFAYSGRHFRFDQMLVSKHPFDVPLLFGGHSAPALRRCATVGDGWVSSISNNVDELVELSHKIDGLRAEAGTQARPFSHWIKVNSDDPDELDRIRGLGVTHVVLYGEKIWGPGKVDFKTRRRRLEEVASRLHIGN